MGPGTAPDPSADPAGTNLATLAVAGDSVSPAGPLPARTSPPEPGVGVVSVRRQLVLATPMAAGADMGSAGFTINGRPFEAGRTDITVAAGAVEEWTLINRSPMDHPFHLHVWPMMLVAENGRPVEPAAVRDVVNVPANGEATVRIAFRDYTGRSVYHCHILDHEDLGMMGVLEVR